VTVRNLTLARALAREIRLERDRFAGTATNASYPTLAAFAAHGEVGPPLPRDGGDCEAVLARFTDAGVDLDALAARLQEEGAAAFAKSWNELLAVLEKKSAVLRKTG
jgi:transaldolase